MCRRRWQVGCSFQHFERIVAYVVGAHFRAQKVFADRTAVDALFEQAEKEVLLIAVGMCFIFTTECVFAEEVAARTHKPHHRRKEWEAFRRSPIGGQAGFPRLCSALCGVQHFCRRGKFVEIVPLLLQQADAVAIFQAETNPGFIVEFKVEHGVELSLGLPMAQLCAIQ